MEIGIGAREARNRLLELLRQVKAGKRFTITHRGEAMADLVPSKGVKPKDKRAAVEKFMAFMRENPVRAGDTAVFRSGSAEAFKKISAEVLANRPKPKKGESIMRELNESRLRRGKLR